MRPFAFPVLLTAALLLAGCASGTSSSSGETVELKTEQDKTVYALGLLMGGNLGPLSLTSAELELVARGINDAATGKKPEVDLQVYGPKIQEFASARAGAAAEAEKTKSASFLTSAAKEPGAVQTSSGLIYRTLKAGTGGSPLPSDTVKVNYKGTLSDGTQFDSSYDRGQPVEFPLKGVIPCWTEGVQKMKVGEKAKLICPSSIAYGDQGRPPQIPGGATLIFEVELLEIKK